MSASPTGPRRIQRKRTKGWRMPNNAIYVGRPTLWGNPYPVQIFGIELALKLFRNSACGMWIPTDCPPEFSQCAYRMHIEWTKRMRRHPHENIRSVLHDSDLACWCPLDQPCHADVLLELANA